MVSDLVAGPLVLLLIAGGGIVVIDALLIRRIRRMKDSTEDEP
jgi:hypothetical protein